MWLGPYIYNGNVPLSSGRWFLRYWDIFNFGIHVNPYTTIMTLLLFVLGTEVMTSIYEIKSGSWKDYLISMLFLCNMIVCVAVSYLQVSRSFGLAFLFAMVCAKCIVCSIKRNMFVFLGSVCLAFTMGIYQAYLGCILLAALIYMVLMIQKGCDFRKIAGYFLRGCITGILGFVLYELLLHINLWWFNTEMSAYNGANEISLWTILKSFIPSVKKAYTVFGQYFSGKNYRWNILSDRLQIICLGVLILYTLWRGIVSVLKSHIHILLWILLLLLVPMAANITFILAPASSFQPQQTAQVALVVPMLCVIIFSLPPKNAMPYAMAVLSAVLLLHGMIGQTLTEQEAMYEGTLASEKIAENVFHALTESNLYKKEKRYALIGAPCDNPMFYVTPLYYKANGYAKVGGPWWNSYLDLWSWRGIFNYRLGIQMPFCDESQYNELLDSEEVQNMPLFPAEGAIKEINDIVVIKIS